jgi:hypothetical protein
VPLRDRRRVFWRRLHADGQRPGRPDAAVHLHDADVRPLRALHGPRELSQRLLQPLRHRGKLFLRPGLHERCDVWRRPVHHLQP